MTMEERIVYKVVSNPIVGVYGSAVVPQYSRWYMTYSIGEKTFPVKGTYLYAFIDTQNATIFADSLRGLTTTLLECKADTVHAVPCGSSVLSDMAFHYYWFPKPNPIAKRLAPLGTIWCRWIEPIRRIEWTSA